MYYLHVPVHVPKIISVMATVKLVIRKKKLTNNQYPIVIRLSNKGATTTYLRIDGLSCYESEWNTELARFKRNKPDYKELNKTLLEIETKIDSISSKLLAKNKFSVNRFKDLYLDKKDSDNVVSNYLIKIKQLKQINKIGTANFYNDSMVAFIEYSNSKDVTFDDITSRWLDGFKSKQLAKGNKINTVAVYLRGLRAIHYDYCKRNNINRPSAYLQTGIATEPTRHRALSKEQLQKLLGYKCKTPFEQRTINIFFASFYLRGINLMDIAQLTNQSVVNNRLEYKRSKTGSLFSVPIIKEVQKILDYFNDDTSKYLFPIVKNEATVKDDVRMFNRVFNRILKRISESLNLPTVTFYYARHSYASILRTNGVGIDLISASLGHSSTKITEIYLSSFPDSKIDEVSTNLL